MENLRGCIRLNLCQISIISCDVLFQIYLRCQSACIEFKSCRIVVTFWSSSSPVVSDEFQGRILLVHALTFDKRQVIGKSGFEKWKYDQDVTVLFFGIALNRSSFAARRGCCALDRNPLSHCFMRGHAVQETEWAVFGGNMAEYGVVYRRALWLAEVALSCIAKGHVIDA